MNIFKGEEIGSFLNSNTLCERLVMLQESEHFPQAAPFCTKKETGELEASAFIKHTWTLIVPQFSTRQIGFSLVYNKQLLTSLRLTADRL